MHEVLRCTLRGHAHWQGHPQRTANSRRPKVSLSFSGNPLRINPRANESPRKFNSKLNTLEPKWLSLCYLGHCCATSAGSPAMAPHPVSGLAVKQSPGGWVHAGGRLSELMHKSEGMRRGISDVWRHMRRSVMGTMEGANQLHPVRFATGSRQGLVLQAPWQCVAHIVRQSVNAKGDKNFIHGWKQLCGGTCRAL